jgi:hypothetical protein
MNIQAPELRAVAANLKSLGAELRSGAIELKLASELANIYGKELKAQQLILMERIFTKDNGVERLPPLPGESQQPRAIEAH